MLIRITSAAKGLAEYLENGKKAGREFTRDQLDERRHIMGDLEDFRRAVEHTNDTREWNSHYLHITESYGLDEQDLDDETIRKITEEILQFYTLGYHLDDVSYHAEYHAPKIQTIEADGKRHQRLGHAHIAISKFDHVNDRQLLVRPFNYKVEKAFQSYICEKYNLIDPQDRPRSDPITRKDILARTKNDLADSKTKKSKTSVIRESFAEITSGATTIQEAKEYLLESDLVKSVRLAGSKKNRYLKVELAEEGANDINLQGGNGMFYHLEKLIYTPEELEERGKAKPKATMQENEEIIREAQIWWLKHLVDRDVESAYEQLQEIDPENEIFQIKVEQEDRLDIVDHNNKASSENVSSEANDQVSQRNLDENDQVSQRNLETDKPKNTKEQQMEELGSLYEKYFVNNPIGNVPDNDKDGMMQRSYYKMFGNNIRSEFVEGLRAHVDKTTGFKNIFDDKTGLMVTAKENGVSLVMPKNKQEQKRAIELAIKVAIDSGMQLENIEVTGNKKYVRMVQAEIDRILADKDYQQNKGAKIATDGISITEHQEKVKTPKLDENKLDYDKENIAKNWKGAGFKEKFTTRAFFKQSQKWFVENIKKWFAVKDSNNPDEVKKAEVDLDNSKRLLTSSSIVYKRPQETETYQKSRGKPADDREELTKVSEIRKGITQTQDRIIQKACSHDLDELKKLDANLVLAWAKKNLHLDRAHYVVTDDNKIKDLRTEAAPKTTIDFVTRTCNHSFQDALVMLEKIKEADLVSQRNQERNKQYSYPVDNNNDSGWLLTP